MPDKNPYRALHARMSPPGAAWDEGFAAGRAAATPDPPSPGNVYSEARCAEAYERGFAAAEAAVLAAVDARTAEIVKALTEQARAIPLGDRSEDSYNVAIRLVREVARRFPNGGTNDGK